MAKLIAWLKRRLPTQRRLIQLYTALLYNAHVKGFIKGDIYTGNTKMLCVPGFNCYSCPGAVGACPLGALQNAVASSGKRAPTYILGILLLYGLTLGRTICGFLCPVGLMQELLHKIPTPKLQKNRITHALSYLKYAILAVFVLAIPLGYALQNVPMPAFCKYICPAGTFEGAIGLLSNPVNADKYGMLGILFTRKYVILIVTIAICVFIYRAFCRFLCPLGAIYGFFARIAVIGVKVDLPKCIDCGKCVRSCKMDVRHVGDHECIHCGECIDACPTSAISFKAGKYTIHGAENLHDVPTKKRKVRNFRLIAWTVALVVLAVALVWYNINEADFIPTVSDENAAEAPVMITESDIGENTVEPAAPFIEIGKDVGMRAPDFSALIYGSDSVFTLSEHRGKKVVINFWATWCTPCVNELPHFDSIHRQYGKDVTVVAIHSSLVTDDVEAYLANFDYELPFALDKTGEIIKSFGGSTMLPQTIIVNEEGVITYNAVGSVTSEKLESLLSIRQTDLQIPEPFQR